ncbi:MAG: helix-turn-helix transcriptional regulator [Oscillospiraceae bacterium]|nr:helix-turn-helix transcriptional regulator [Oscillospiraceae bacterium]MCI9395026.1 helix-turn-helix transcriptional regulator [Oscillospiraceae bacterium]MCI9580607.1 helix-turn-helix transcriptional regulator [Oscillospiraceae bacterium]
MKGIITYHTEEYGNIRVKLAEVLDSRGITRNRLATLTGAKYAIIDRYYKAEQIEMVDLNLFAKICYVLDCKIEDLLEYTAPES